MKQYTNPLDPNSTLNIETMKPKNPKETKLKIRRTHIKRQIGFCKNSKPLYQYDLEGNLLTTWNNANEAEKALSNEYNNQFSKRFYRQVISRCARGDRLTAYGFIWRYV